VCFVDANCWLQGEGLGRDGVHLSSAGQQRVFGELLERVGVRLGKQD
jgi:lysophospholipase L1-like esterase